LVQQVVVGDFDCVNLFAGSIPPQVIQADVGDNTVDPGTEGALETEAVQLLVNLQKCLLMDVLSVACRPGEPQSKP